MRRIASFFLACATFLPWPVIADEGSRQMLEYAAAPLDNPLKGLVPYAGDGHDQFPHSMEFNYIPLSVLVTGYGQYDWTALEDLLNAAADRGHQAIFRVFLEYPGHKNVIPAFLIKDGLKVQKYVNANTNPFSEQEVETPDYSDPKLRKVLKDFIAALGAKYDGDPRIGFITAGLLGTWGEWHDYPRDDLFASKEVQIEVMDAYEAAFRTTPILVRYPIGEGQERKAPNEKRHLGYHDDSFAWATIETGKPADAWFFMAQMKAAGSAALDKWKTQPIGGEIRPEAWGHVFDSIHDKQIQDFQQCVEATHASWLMDSGMFQNESEENGEQIKRAGQKVSRLGYEFYIPTVTTSSIVDQSLEVKVEVENLGVAPFYYDWPIEFGLLDSDGNVVKTFKGTGRLTGLLPGDQPRVWYEKLALQGVSPGKYQLALCVPNSLPRGLPVRFANKTQNQQAPGWLILTSVAW